MKNIHILPTDKPTWLHKSTLTGVLRKSSSCIDDMKQAQGMNIYITSDEEIKEGEYQLYNPLGNFDNAKVSKAERLLQNDGRRKKIILTTDQDLIKDGIQAIDDEFLEWFVKNPSYEEVEVIPLRKSSGWYDEKNVWHWDFLAYKIIIPKEEPNPFKNMLPLTKVDWEKFKKNPIPNKKEEPKQETLEEAAERLFPYKMEEYEIFLMGAKWQQERIQNLRDELYNELPTGEVSSFDLIKIINSHIKKLDEQFKKK